MFFIIMMVSINRISSPNCAAARGDGGGGIREHSLADTNVGGFTGDVTFTRD